MSSITRMGDLMEWEKIGDGVERFRIPEGNLYRVTCETRKTGAAPVMWGMEIVFAPVPRAAADEIARLRKAHREQFEDSGHCAVCGSHGGGCAMCSEGT